MLDLLGQDMSVVDSLGQKMSVRFFAYQLKNEDIFQNLFVFHLGHHTSARSKHQMDNIKIVE